jgi:hypothetical protein
MPTLQNADFETRLAIAQADTTPTEILAELATDTEMQIRQAVARNPNSSIESFMQLVEKFSDEVIADPIFERLLFENPESSFIKKLLPHSSKTEPETLEKLANELDGEILHGIMHNPNTPSYRPLTH